MWFGRLRSRSCRVPMMGLPQRQIRNRCFWAESIGSMAFPAAASRLEAIGALMALSPTERDLPGQCGEDEATMTTKTPPNQYGTLRLNETFLDHPLPLRACTAWANLPP